MSCIRLIGLLPLVLASTFHPAFAQTASKSCPAPPAILSSSQLNIFSEQQEQWLGDAMADMLEREYKPIQDPAENEYLAGITKRLLAAVPPTTIQFRVILVDSPEVNGFSLAGGRVYLTRKLVANARNEDEVATVIAHEMGHILSHQFAVEFTADLKRLLNVTSVTDKADIYAKFQRLIDASMKDKHPSRNGNSDEGQDEADTVAVYAAGAAGYRPQAYSEFWDRMFFVDGKVGGSMSDFFGTTKPESKRLRSILKLVTALPAGCGGTQPTKSPEFEHWHSLVVANQPANFALDLKPVSEVALNPPLRMNVERLRFSRDGAYILAQDEGSVSILSREPYHQIFRFDAEDALPADFTPDSHNIVFHTRGLHTEEWSIADRKLMASHEPVSRNGCMQTRFSPDGRTLFCLSPREEDENMTLDLSVLDAATGDLVLQKKGLIDLDFELYEAIVAAEQYKPSLELFGGSFSADGKTLLIGPSSNKIAFDLQSRTLIPVGHDLKNSVNGSYAFLGNDRVIGNVSGSLGSYLSGITVSETALFSFPEGKKLQNVPFHVADLQSTTDGNFFLTHSLDDYPVALADMSAGKFVAASQAASLDVWDKWLVNENADGTILLHKLADKTTADQTVTLPLSPLSGRMFAAVSPDHKLLALSSHSRAAVWNLQTGRQIFLSRGFSSALFAPDNSLFLEFPKLGKQVRGIHHISFSPTSGAPVAYKESDNTHLSGGLLQEWKPAGRHRGDFIIHKVDDNSIVWQHTYPDGEPAHTNNLLLGQTILSFPLKTDFAKSRLKADANLAAVANGIKSKDAGRLIQLLDNNNGTVLQEQVIEVPLTYEGVQGINIVADKLYLTSEDNRTMVYSLVTGAQLRQFFGSVIALDAASGRICTVNRRDEATVFDSAGNQVAIFRTGSPLRFATFQQSGNRLTLLTADQKVRTMEITGSPQQISAVAAH